MPAPYTQKIANRGDAAAAIVGSDELRPIAVAEGAPEDVLHEIAQRAKEAKDADAEQRRKQAESKKRNETLTKEYRETRKEYTLFKERRQTRLEHFQDPSQSKLLSALTADYTTKVQVKRLTKEGKEVDVMVESEAIEDRLREIADAVSAVLAEPDLVASFVVVNYGEDKLSALLKRVRGHQAELTAIETLRKEAEAATKREHASVDRVNALWKSYGPSLRRAAEKSPAIEALLKNT